MWKLCSLIIALAGVGQAARAQDNPFFDPQFVVSAFDAMVRPGGASDIAIVMTDEGAISTQGYDARDGLRFSNSTWAGYLIDKGIMSLERSSGPAPYHMVADFGMLETLNNARAADGLPRIFVGGQQRGFPQLLSLRLDPIESLIETRVWSEGNVDYALAVGKFIVVPTMGDLETASGTAYRPDRKYEFRLIVEKNPAISGWMLSSYRGQKSFYDKSAFEDGNARNWTIAAAARYDDIFAKAARFESLPKGLAEDATVGLLPSGYFMPSNMGCTADVEESGITFVPKESRILFYAFSCQVRTSSTGKTQRSLNLSCVGGEAEGSDTSWERDMQLGIIDANRISVDGQEYHKCPM